MKTGYLTAFFLSAVLAAPAAAQTLNVGYVNTPRIFRDAPAARAVAKKLENEFSARDQGLQKMAKRLQQMQESLERDAVTLPTAELRMREKEYNDLSRDFQRRQREFREDLNVRQNEENAAIIERANQAIAEIAKREKLDLILQEVVWVNPKLDITDLVIKSLSER